MTLKEKMGIEFVCTGNGGRSPTAQTIGRNYVENLGLEDTVKIYSSGTQADLAEAYLFQFPLLFLLDYIEIGFKSGTYQGSAKDTAEQVVAKKQEVALAVEKGDREARRIVEYCIRYLMADEVVKRNQVLLEIGLVPETRFHRQANVRDDVDLVLAMKQSNADYVRKLYEGKLSGGTESIPTIAPLCEYAGMPGQVDDPFGGTLADFRKTRDLIGEAVRKSIDRAIKEYLG